MLRFEVRLQRSMYQAKNRATRYAASKVNNGGIPWMTLEKEHAEDISRILSKYYREIIPAFSKQEANNFKAFVPMLETKADSQVEFWRKLTTRWILQRGLTQSVIVNEIAKTTVKDIRSAISAGVSEGEGQESIRRRIQAITPINAWRAAAIARTETHAAANYASAETVREVSGALQAETEKRWVATMDERTREGHLEISDAGEWINIDDDFEVRATLTSPYEFLDRPGDPAGSPETTIQCRCVCVNRIAGLSFD